MKYFQFRHQLLKSGTYIIGLIMLLMFSSVGLNAMAWAEASDQSDDNQGLPAGTVGGGSRGVGTECNTEEPLMAFMPDTSVLKITAAQPILWVYIPYSETFTNAEFILYDHDNKPLVDTTFSVAQHSGLVSLDLDVALQNHAIHSTQNYRWFLSLICHDNRAADIVVDGWVQPTASSPVLEKELIQSEPIEQATLYLQEGLWSEAFFLLFHWYEHHQTNTAYVPMNEWQTVLETISPEPVSLDLTHISQLNFN